MPFVSRGRREGPKRPYRQGVQPTQLATISAATRICEELEVQVGSFVGHVTRFEDRTSGDSLLRFVTEEALFREALEDPLLERYSVIILDEVQQRTCEMDVLLGILKMVMQRRPELKLLLLSSSEEVRKVQSHFEGAPLLKVPHRTFAVEVLHTQEAERDYLKAAVRTTIQVHTTEPDGDILLFLPHEDEIDLACQMLRKEAVHLPVHLDVRPIYVGLPLMDIQRAFEPAPSRMGAVKSVRKVVVATNVAETSLCIDHIVYVIDTGLVKQRAYNPRTAFGYVETCGNDCLLPI